MSKSGTGFIFTLNLPTLIVRKHPNILPLSLLRTRTILLQYKALTSDVTVVRNLHFEVVAVGQTMTRDGNEIVARLLADEPLDDSENSEQVSRLWWIIAGVIPGLVAIFKTHVVARMRFYSNPEHVAAGEVSAQTQDPAR